MHLEEIKHSIDESRDQEQPQQTVNIFCCGEKGCSYTTKRKFDLKRHGQKMHHCSSIQEKQVQPQRTFQRVEQGCQYTTKRIFDLKQHGQKMHRFSSQQQKQGQQQLIFQCVERGCQYTTKRQFNLKRHQQKMHSDIIPQRIYEYLCDHCGKQYSSKYGLNLHINDFHKHEYRFTCKTCDAGFNRLGDFTTHVNKHNNIKTDKCDTCGKTFHSKKALAKHMKRHFAASGEFTFSCNVCGLKYSSKDALMEHNKGAHEGRVFSCPCGKTFAWRSSAKYHSSICKAMK